MVGSHKILTVSYGTFSCTLEGFEDSFETMKAIAEYFRDLAAEDRYFGAEPPQPDADMLARIAEREIARRVEARMEASGIVLRVGQSLDKAPEPAPAPAPAAQVMPPSTPAEPAPAPAPAESVAAKLQRIRSVVGKGAAPLPPADEDAGYDDIPDDTEAMIDAAISEAIAAPATATGPEPAAKEEPSTEAVVAAETPAADTALVPPEPPAADLPSDEPAKDIVADEPAIEAPKADVAEAPSAVEEPDEAPVESAAPVRPRVIRMRKSDFDRIVASGALAAQPDEPADEPALDLPGADLAADLAEAAEAERPEEEAELDDFVDPADLADLARLDAPAPTLSPDEEAELLAELAAVESGEDIDMPSARMATPVPAPALDDELAATLAAIAADTWTPPQARSDDGPAVAPQAAPDRETRPEPATALDDDDIMTGVLRAIEAEEPAAMAETEPAERAAESEPEATAAPEAVSEVTAETVAEPEATAEPEVEPESEYATEAQPQENAEEPAPETHAHHDEAIPAEEPQAETEDDLAAPARSRFTAPEDDEAALDRLMSQTDAQMSGPDAARRRESIAQLRAAVAATEAARALGETQTEDSDGEGSFREDLRQAVRPRRPVAGQPDLRGERPRPAPLKLVASQRIDIPADAAPQAPAAMQPIRPRRVTVDRTAEVAPTALPEETAAAMAASGSFTEFAESMGATSLADLLEAAAAYTAFVEGSEDFSRPQILRKVSMMSPETTREDGLRSFGTLLREGRFRRSPRAGRFEVAEDTRFNPDRHAG